MNDPAPPAEPVSFAYLRSIASERFNPTTLLAALLVLAVLYTLYFARAFLLPIVVAVLLAVILTPAVRGLKRLHIPRGLAAALVTVALAASLGGLLASVHDPAAQWIEKAPSTLAEVESKLRGIKKSVEGVAKVAEKVEQLATPATTIGVKPPPAAVPAQPSLLHKTFSTTLAAIVNVGTVLVLLFFLLATGDVLLQKTINMMPTHADKARVVEIVSGIESQMARYFGTVTLINAGLGIATGIAMYWLGMPNPVLWGAMAFAFNYFPYLGAAASLAVLTVVAALSFDEVRQALAVPAVFFTFVVIEGQFLSPLIIGRHLILNPVVILLSMLFWAWLWGVVGALLAVPILVGIRIFCEHNERLKPLGEWLGGKLDAPRSGQLATKL